MADFLSFSSSKFFFVLFLFFLITVFLMGGGARGDIESLVVIRPLAVICLMVGCWGLSWDRLRDYGALLILAAAVMLLPAIHLVPLPPALWSALPGRDIIEKASAIANMELPWRPLSLVPHRTWNSLFALSVPASALLLMLRCSPKQRYQILLILIFAGLVSGILGLLQVIGPSSGSLYFYQITNQGSAVGLFANRNHNAFFLSTLFPMLAIYASKISSSVQYARLKNWLAIIIGLLLIPLIFLTGSRGGILLGIVGLAAAVSLYRRTSAVHMLITKRSNPHLRRFMLLMAVLLIISLTVFFAKALSLERLLNVNLQDELRFRIWGPIMHMTWHYFPVGSGIGTFDEIYRIAEPFDTLALTYVNHAHNDLLEILLTGGLPAFILLIAAIIFWLRASWSLFHSRSKTSGAINMGRLGAVLLFMAAIASMIDYPLRTPSIAVLLVISAVWTASGFRRTIQDIGD